MTNTQINAEIARIESLSDEDLLAEVRAEGFDPDEVAERTRAVLVEAVNRWKGKEGTK